MSNSLRTVAVLAIAAGFGLDAQPGVAAAATVPDLAGMPVRQLAGQRVIVGWEGADLPGWLIERVRRGEVGGVIAFRRNFRTAGQLARQLRRLQALPRPFPEPLLTMVDQEGGYVKRLPGHPVASALGMGGHSTRWIRRQGLLTAANLRAAGITVDLAPVLDLGRPGSYQLKTGRAFGSSPGRVMRAGTAFAQGLQDGGVAACLKHFPGLGGATGDEDLFSHPIRFPLDVLRGEDEAPFAAGISRGAMMVMTSTARYPGMDRRAPALLSRQIVTRELRGRLGFRGVIVSDAMGVAALRPFGSPAELAVRATRAGNDLLLYGSGSLFPKLGLNGVVSAVARGRLTRAELVEHVQRILSLRRRLGCPACA